MFTTIPCVSLHEDGIKYYFDNVACVYSPLHPLVFSRYLQEKHNSSIKYNQDSNHYLPEEYDYYNRKYSYLHSYGIFGEVTDAVSEETKYMDGATVSRQIANLKQLVFEVTDDCNLKCEYCAYGAMYYDYDEREGKYLSFDAIRQTIDFIFPRLSNNGSILYVSFYGGEPLLAIGVIKETVDYINTHYKHKSVQFSMTTNGILLDKHVEFLKDNDFRVLVSLDGNEYNHSYRVNMNGANSFCSVFWNLKLIQKQHPDFFDRNIQFNSVLHNRNSGKETHGFLFKEFGKVTHLSSLDSSGIKPEQLAKFKTMSETKLLAQGDFDKRTILQEQKEQNPFVYETAFFFQYCLKNSFFDTYEELLMDRLDNEIKIPSGTCLPFQKKLFVTVNGKILACERISQEYVLGTVDKDGVNIDCDLIAQKYNEYFNCVRNQCDHCYLRKTCKQCLFQIDHFSEKKQCVHASGEKGVSKWISQVLSFLENVPEAMKLIVDDVLIV